jgi:hypothetical protein
MSLLDRGRNLLKPDREGIGPQLDQVIEMLGSQEIRRRIEGPRRSELRDYGVKVFAQTDEDGILAYLISEIAPPKTFVEIGVGDYRESNTRHLIKQGDWRGLIIEGGPENCRRIRGLGELWRFDLQLAEAFVTRETVDDLIRDAGIEGEIGILSLDIDGNDYWVWRGITAVRPAIVVVEFNGRFGADRPVTVPYDPSFTRNPAAAGGIYFGASLAAMVKLGEEKGYAYVGSNGADVNAFFVRTDLLPDTISTLTATEGFRRVRTREMRGQDGSLLFAGSEREDAALAEMPLVEV